MPIENKNISKLIRYWVYYSIILYNGLLTTLIIYSIY